MAVDFKWNADDYRNLLASCDADEATPYIIKYMPTTGTILDAGCGLGRFVSYLGNKGYGVRGLEVSNETIKMLHALKAGFNVDYGDINNMPYPDASMSGVISLGVVEHFMSGPAAPLKEIFRVLRKSSYAVITVPSFNFIRKIKFYSGIHDISPARTLRNSNTLRKIFRKELVKGKNDRVIPFACRDLSREDAFFEYQFTKKEFEAALVAVGFSIIESVPIAHIDGIFHEFGKAFVHFENWAFKPTLPGSVINSLLSCIPFFHNHMHLCVVRK